MAIDSIFRMDVDNTCRALRGAETNVAAVSVTPSVTRIELSHPLQPHAAVKVPWD